jgi:hypothetical protein
MFDSALEKYEREEEKRIVEYKSKMIEDRKKIFDGLTLEEKVNKIIEIYANDVK